MWVGEKALPGFTFNCWVVRAISQEVRDLSCCLPCPGRVWIYVFDFPVYCSSHHIIGYPDILLRLIQYTLHLIDIGENGWRAVLKSALWGAWPQRTPYFPKQHPPHKTRHLLIGFFLPDPYLCLLADQGPTSKEGLERARKGMELCWEVRELKLRPIWVWVLDSMFPASRASYRVFMYQS